MNGYISHTVGVGDSVQRLAVVYGVDNWREIVELNGLVPPYIDDRLPHIIDADPLPEPKTPIKGKIARPGDQLVIPMNYTTPLNAKLLANSDVENQAYGRDLDIFTYNNNQVQYLSGQGQLDDNGLGDLAISAGVNNLRQRMIIRLLVPLGAFLLYPDFGSRLATLTGLPNTVETSNKIQIEIRRSILSDSMVKSVENLTIERFRGGVKVNCTVYPIPPYDPFILNEGLVVA